MPVIALLLLVGCVGQSPGDLDPNPDSPPMAGTPVAGESAALGLVNLWRVHGADGEDHPTWLRLDAWDFQLWRDCGMIMGSWRATESLFLADANSASGDCASSGMPTVAWLADATEFVPTSDGYDLLLGASGATVASLTIDGAPEPIPTAAEFYTEPPEITEEVRATFHKAAELPDGLLPATAVALEGKWVPVAYAVSTDPHVSFSAAGTWSGSDGCNGMSGRWTASGTGELLVTAGPSTLIYCEGAPVPTWVAQAISAGFNDDQWLLLFDAAGTVVGRLVAA